MGDYRFAICELSAIFIENVVVAVVVGALSLPLMDDDGGGDGGIEGSASLFYSIEN